MSVSLPRQWLEKATEDLTVARLVLKEEHTAHACFLSQQCIEKSLKAYLLAKSNTYPRAHKLMELLKGCEPFNATFSQFRNDCLVIDQYYIPTRYPDGIPGGTPTGMPSTAEATEAIAAAEKILLFITQQLS
jgi:HEPN domain-containing protein